jgi:hypothetical protein
MTEIGARIMPYPAPQEHPADKEGSPTVSGRYRHGPLQARMRGETLCYSSYIGTAAVGALEPSRGRSQGAC